MDDLKMNKDIVSEKQTMNILQLQSIRENIAVFIKSNMDDNKSIPYFVRNSLETALIDVALYLEQEKTECE